MLAQSIRENDRCPKCRQFTEDWQDDHKRALNPPPLEITEWYCEPCAQWERAERDSESTDVAGVRLKYVAPAPVLEPEPIM